MGVVAKVLCMEFIAWAETAFRAEAEGAVADAGEVAHHQGKIA